MTIREAAEQVLFGTSLEEKLLLAPADLSDEARGKALALPDAPGRPPELRMRSGDEMAVKFPSLHQLEKDRERGVMLHFLANHELLAAELMALVLLKFPDAPAEYRRGVYEAMREEQIHTRMYLRRMRECGMHFGELPVNDYFWKIVASMETPLDFVTRLNLTFEQANLDFSKHYARLFREVGDTGTAAVLDKIYQDEIGHVGHGVKWFREWKERGCSDWDAYRKTLIFPLTPARAKGIAPFNAEGRRLAGLDEDFIRHLEISAQSRGRTPVVHWFNPDAEAYAMAAATGARYQPDKTALALQHDLEILSFAWARRDDVCLMRGLPSASHLARLKSAGFGLPEFVRCDVPLDRKLGGLRPWAWTPDAVKRLEPLSDDVSPSVSWQWRGDFPLEWFSKKIGLRLEEKLGLVENRGVICTDETSAWNAISRYLPHAQALVKAAFSCAGRGHRRINAESPEGPTRNWLRNTLRDHGSVIVEPWLERVTDFSALYEKYADGRVELIGMTVMENDAAGRFQGTRVGPKWANLLPSEIAAFLFREADVMRWYQEKIPTALSDLLPEYIGPLGVDAMVHRRENGLLALRPVVELNVRMTMGRIALELLAKTHPQRNGAFRILRKEQWLPLQVALNDPETAKRFIGVWE
ncbi:MAG: DUF455 family protein [Luteolibacter sp.]